jgi:NADH-quinone oxidoreductase subunit G
VLGNLLDVAGFDFESSEQVRDAALGGSKQEFVSGLSNVVSGIAVTIPTPVEGIERIAAIPAYAGDAVVRRAPSLQAAAESAAPLARANAATLNSVGVACGGQIRVAGIALEAKVDETVAPNCIVIPAARSETIALGSLFGTLTVEKA